MSVPTTLAEAVANVDVYITHINFYEAGADESSASQILSGNLSNQRDVAILVFLLDIYPGTPSSAEQHQITSELRQLLWAHFGYGGVDTKKAGSDLFAALFHFASMRINYKRKIEQ